MLGSTSGQVVSNEDRPLFCHDWMVRQEHKLLESIEEIIWIWPGGEALGTRLGGEYI